MGVGQSKHHHPPLSVGFCVGLSWGDFSLDAILFIWCVQEITEGEGREDFWSAINDLFFISMSLI